MQAYIRISLATLALAGPVATFAATAAAYGWLI